MNKAKIVCLKNRKHRPTPPRTSIAAAKQFISPHRRSSVVDSSFINPWKPIFNLAFSCFHTESPARAVTKNKESFRSRNADTLDTVIVVDGLARVIQTKVEAEVSPERNGSAQYGMTITGTALFFYHPDHIGSTTFVSDAQGREYEHIEYTPYGETWLNTRRGNDDDHDDDEWDWDDDEGSPIRRRFTGKEIDPETGLQYFGARYQDPRTSRWISSDPAGPELMSPMDDEGRLCSGYSVVEALNWYSYTSDNPVRFIDPTGMMNWDQVGSGLLQMGGGIVKMKGRALLIGSSGGSAVLSGGAATPAAVLGTIVGGGLIADGFVQSVTELAIAVDGIVAEPGDSSYQDIPSTLSQIVGMAGDAFIEVATGKESDILENTGKAIGKMPPGPLDLFLSDPAPAHAPGLENNENNRFLPEEVE